VCESELTDSDGLEFFEKARIYRQKSVNILLTDYGESAPLSQAFDQGVAHMFEKPFSLVSFMHTICDHLVRIDAPSHSKFEFLEEPAAFVL
jgi:DNA-binding response OmpR family regulator